MTDEKKKILEMLAEGKITVDDAHRLMGALSGSGGGEARTEPKTDVGKGGKYLRVVVVPTRQAEEKADYDRVNIRVPMSLIRAGIKLTSLIPAEATDKMHNALQQKGIDFDLRKLKADDIEQLIEALGELEVDVESGREKVKVFVE